MVLSNFSVTFRRFVIGWLPGENIYRFEYTTKNGEFKMREDLSWKGLTMYSKVEHRFNRYKQCYPTTTDTILYRTFKKNGWQFWNWLAFFIHPRYKLLYIDPDKVPVAANKLPPTVCPGEFD
ncbi:hypothetical protein [Spirosoma koreense]